MTGPNEDAATAWSRHQTPNLPALLADVRATPGMWLGRRTIAGLRLFRDGLQYAESFHAISVSCRLGGFDFVAFESWVAAQFNGRRLSVDSFWLAADLAGSDTAGFDRWFEWYDQCNADADRR